MNAFLRWTRASVLLFSLTALLVSLGVVGVTRGESRIQKTLEPKFFAGCPVLWSDGSRGIILERQEYRDDQWYYLVQLGGAEGLCWSLPETGLSFNQSSP